MKIGDILIPVTRMLDERNLPSLWKLSRDQKKPTGHFMVVSREELAPKRQLSSQQLTTRCMEKGAHFMRWSQRLHLAQMSGTKLIQTGDAQKSHSRNDFSIQQFKNAN